MNELWLHPALAVGWGATALGALGALIAALSRKLRPVEAATAALLAAPFGAGLGLLAFVIRDCDRPTFEVTVSGREIAECQHWATHPGALIPGIILLCVGIGATVLLRRSVRGARRGSREPLGPRSFLRIFVGSVAAFLLASMGGQIVAAPVTVPLLYWLVADARAASATLLTIVATLTMLFVGWLLTYASLGETLPMSLIGPLACAAGTAVLFIRRYRRAHARTRSSAAAASRTAG